jgi:excisionase family DNA binding protein
MVEQDMQVQQRKKGWPRLPRLTYSIGEIAESLGVSEGFVRLEIQRGKLDTRRAGRRVLVTKASFDQYLDA